MVMRSFLILLIFLCLKSTGQEFYKPNQPASQLYLLTLNNKFNSADSLIKKYDRFYKNDIEYQLSAINFYWWKFLSNGNNPYYSSLIHQRLDDIEQLILPKKEIDNLTSFVFIASVAFDARVYLANESYGKAVKLLTKYRTDIKNSIGKEAIYPPYYLTSGLFKYTYAHATGKVPLLPVFNRNSVSYEKAEGLLFLKKASLLNDPLIRTESLYFLMKILAELEDDFPAAEKYCKMLNNIYPDNLLFKYYRIKLIEKNKNDDLRKHLAEYYELLRQNTQLTQAEKKYYHELVADYGYNSYPAN